MTPELVTPCPECGEHLFREDVVIEYGTDRSDRAGFAECPGCASIVNVSV